MKARAWLNLSDLFHTNGSVDEKDVRKHKNDIIRLYQSLNTNIRIQLPKNIKQDVQNFLIDLRINPPDLKALGLKNLTPDELIDNLSQIYGLSIEEKNS